MKSEKRATNTSLTRPAIQVPVLVEYAGAPKGKGRPRFSRRSGTAYTPTATRSYEGGLQYAAQVAMGDRPPLLGPLRVCCHDHSADARGMLHALQR